MNKIIFLLLKLNQCQWPNLSHHPTQSQCELVVRMYLCSCRTLHCQAITVPHKKKKKKKGLDQLRSDKVQGVWQQATTVRGDFLISSVISLSLIVRHTRIDRQLEIINVLSADKDAPEPTRPDRVYPKSGLVRHRWDEFRNNYQG